MKKCKRCGKEIIWGKTLEEERIALEPSATIYSLDMIGQIVEANDSYVVHSAVCSND